jgi:FtsH-binding integral membrane protein
MSMSDFDRNVAAGRGGYADRAVAIDAGLRAHMISVYNYMAAAVALTGVVAWFTYNAGVVISGPAMLVLFLATIGLVFFISFRIHTLSFTTAMVLFMGYAALLGVVLSTIFAAYTGASITRVFFISAASFGALSLYGYTTQRDLSPIGSFLIMGLIGIIIAGVVNIWLASTALQFALSVVGVLVFAGLTAYDTQQIKEMYSVQDDGTVAGRKAVIGALKLYLDFINLFLSLLQLFGDRR